MKYKKQLKDKSLRTEKSERTSKEPRAVGSSSASSSITIKKSSADEKENDFYIEYQRVKRALPIWKTLFDMKVEERTAAWDELDRIWNPIRDHFA